MENKAAQLLMSHLVLWWYFASSVAAALATGSLLFLCSPGLWPQHSGAKSPWWHPRWLTHWTLWTPPSTPHLPLPLSPLLPSNSGAIGFPVCSGWFLKEELLHRNRNAALSFNAHSGCQIIGGGGGCPKVMTNPWKVLWSPHFKTRKIKNEKHATQYNSPATINYKVEATILVVSVFTQWFSTFWGCIFA